MLHNSGSAFLAAKNDVFLPSETDAADDVGNEKASTFAHDVSQNEEHVVTSSSLPVDLDKWDIAKSLLVFVMKTVRDRGASAMLAVLHFPPMYVLPQSLTSNRC